MRGREGDALQRSDGRDTEAREKVRKLDVRPWGGDKREMGREAQFVFKSWTALPWQQAGTRY